MVIFCPFSWFVEYYVYAFNSIVIFWISISVIDLIIFDIGSLTVLAVKARQKHQHLLAGAVWAGCAVVISNIMIVIQHT